MGIKENIKSLKEEVYETAYKFSRKPEEITIIAISKTFREEHIREAYESGLKFFGENRIQEAEDKILNLRNKLDIEWHLVGHLQSNKVKKAVLLFDMIQSIDKLSTMTTVNEYAKINSKKQKVLIEVNTSKEESKFGMSPDEVNDFIITAKEYPHIELSGLMTIGPLTGDVHKIKDSFLLLKELYEENLEKFPEIPFSYLSMGMTDDFKIAVECGSNMLRIGRRIFGQRSQV